MNLAKIENGTVVQICVFDPDNIPAEFADWIDATDLTIGMVDDGNGNFVEPSVPEITPEELTEIKANAYEKIDTAAEKARLRYVTDGAAQAMTYQLKSTEAELYISLGYPADISSYPFINEEVLSTGRTATQVADDIITQRDTWIVVGASIEGIRLGGKMAVFQAVDVNVISAAVTTAVENLDAI